jgi:hypothetical protein
VLVYSSGVDVSGSALRFALGPSEGTAPTLGVCRRLGRDGRLCSPSPVSAAAAPVPSSRPAPASTPPPSAARSPGFTLLAALAPALAEAVRAALTKAFVIVEGTFLPIDQVAVDLPFLLRQRQEARPERAAHH